MSERFLRGGDDEALVDRQVVLMIVRGIIDLWITFPA